MNWSPFILSFQLAIVTTLVLVILGWIIAFQWNKWQFIGKIYLQHLLNLPVVLPPTVLGFYFLLLFNESTFIGKLFPLAFSFQGLVFASVLYCFPFMFNSIYGGLSQLSKEDIINIEFFAKSKKEAFVKGWWPKLQSVVIQGAALCFMHTIGQFGMILMIGGSIEGKTKVASIAIYEEVEALNYTLAHQYALILISCCVALLGVTAYFMQNKRYA